MSPRVLLSSLVPIVLLPHDAPRMLTTTAAATNLTALLTHSPAEDTVTLTLSDLSTRLLLLRYNLTAVHYEPLRESQSLLIDFAAFPTHICDLLQRVMMASDYVATLRIPEDDEMLARLCIVQTSAVKSITHIELGLTRASHDELVAAVAARAREAEMSDARASQLQVALDTERCRFRDECNKSNVQIKELEESIEQLRIDSADGVTASQRASQLDTECNRLRAAVSERDVQLAGLKSQLENSEESKEENERLKERLTENEEECGRREEARRRMMIERDDAIREKETIEKERDDSVHEITRGNDIIKRLQNEVRVQRAKAKVKSNILGKQEENVKTLEKNAGELERQVRKCKDRCALLEIEKDGLKERLDLANRKLEENAAILSSDQQVIAYLNRELNDRAMGDVTGGTTTGTGATTRPSRRRPAAGNVGVAS